MARKTHSGPIRSTGGFEVGSGTTNTAVIGSDGKISTNGVVTASITDDAVTNAKLANIARGSIKVGGAADAPTDLVAKTSGRILVGDGTDLVSVAVSGDVTLSAAGAVAIGAEKVTNAMLADRQKVVMNTRTRVTTAQVNAGHTLLAAVAGKKYRIHDFSVIAIGGNAATVTAVELKGGTTVIASIAVAALTRSALVKPSTANVTLLADGASFEPMAANTAITIIKNGSDMATATHLDVILSYTLED